MADNIDWNDPGSWGELGREWFETNGRLAGCTDEQIRFAVLRHSGASATAAARGAGYSFTNAAALRQAAYRAARSTGVMNLLSLATASDGLGEGAISDAEVDSKLAKLVRSADARVSIAAIDARERQKARRSSTDEKQMTEEDVVREMLTLDYWGRGTVLASWDWSVKQGGQNTNMSGLPLFKELAPALSREFPDHWSRLLSKLGDESRADAERLAAGPVVSPDQFAAAPVVGGDA